MFGKNRGTTFASRTSSLVSTGLGIETRAQNMNRESTTYKLYYEKCNQILDATLENADVKYLNDLLNDYIHGRSGLDVIKKARDELKDKQTAFINDNLHNSSTQTGSFIGSVNRIRQENLVFNGFKAIGDILNALDVEANMETIKTYNVILTNSVEWDVAFRSDEVNKLR